MELAERLLGKGHDLKIYDPNVSLAKVTGANKQFINEAIPHLSKLLAGSLAELIDCEVMVVGHTYAGVRELLENITIPVVDLRSTVLGSVSA